MDPPAKPDAGDSPTHPLPASHPPPPPVSTSAQEPRPSATAAESPLPLSTVSGKDDTPEITEEVPEPTPVPTPAAAPAAPATATEPASAAAAALSANKNVKWLPVLISEVKPPSPSAAGALASFNVARDASSVPAPPPEPSPWRSRMEWAKETAMRWGKSAGDVTKMVESQARDAWQHLKTGPSVTEAAMSRLAHGTKVIAEGGYAKIFRDTFDVRPEEQLRVSFACYLSTSAGPVMGTIYLSTHKVAFCSDNPLSFRVGDVTEWSYYKVVLPLRQLRSITPSVSKVNPNEKYIHIVSADAHDFWFMGFLRYDSAASCLQESLDFARRFASTS